MADITNILGGVFSAPNERIPDPPEVQLRQAIMDAGLEAPDSIYIDGQLHRFKSGSKGNGKAGDKSGWYICFSDGVPAGRFGDWRSGIEQTFRADVGRKFSPVEEMAFARRMAEAKQIRDDQRKKQFEVISDTVESIWSSCMGASPEHPYLKRKGIGVHGARVTGDGRLVVPLFDADGKLSTLQYIDDKGGKLYHSGGQTGGCFWSVGAITDAEGVIYIAEGFATAATIHEQTNQPCVVAYSASNLVPVSAAIKELKPTSQLTIVADNDKSGIGLRYAEQASAKYGAKVIVPPIPGDANDYQQEGHDLFLLLNPPKSVWLVPADEFSAKPAPISWLVKHWIQQEALIMVHGPSGGGKTFVVLDWCMRIASTAQNFANCRVKTGNVIYLAGEGHHGLKSRIAAWKQHHQVQSMNMWVSQHGCDLNTPRGYMMVLEHIREAEIKPDVIVVDTLHRFLDGDENSSQDAKTMLDACNNLMNEFKCSVILVHHTGVSDDAQHRARGSSAWRGALDIEISIKPSTDETPMEIVQRKSKDAELAQSIFCELTQVPINGWFDEDHEQVHSAILQVIENYQPEQKEKKDSAFNMAQRQFERAWWASDCELRGDQPYVSRSALTELLANDGIKDSTIKNYLKPAYPKGTIGQLLNASQIEPIEHGWRVIDEVWGSSLRMLNK